MVGVEERDPRAVIGVEFDSVRAASRGIAATWVAGDRLHKANLTGLGEEFAHEVALLDREPDVAFRVEHHGVRVPGALVRHHETFDVAGFRVEFTDVSRHTAFIRSVARVPDHAVCGHDQVVGTDALGVVLRELTTVGVEYCDVRTGLAAEPNATVWSHERVTRTRLLVRDLPLLEFRVVERALSGDLWCRNEHGGDQCNAKRGIPHGRSSILLGSTSAVLE